MWSKMINPVANMCDVSNVGKNTCLQIDLEGELFRILANEEKEDSFLVTLFCFCFPSNSPWMQNQYPVSGICCFAAKVSSASKLQYFTCGCSMLQLFLWCIKNK